MLSRAWPIALMLALGAVAFWLQWPLCPSRTLFGIPCPGCGMTRAVVALFMGDWGAAMKFHPLGPAVIVAVLGLPFLRKVSARIVSGLALVGIGALLVVWVVRLAGGLGGLPDPVDPRRGLLGHVAGFIHPSDGARSTEPAP